MINFRKNNRGGLMKKIISLIMILLAGLFLVSCDNSTDDKEVKVYYYSFRRAYREDKLKPDLITTETYEKGSKVTQPTDPRRSGYIFAGWYKDVDFNEEWNFTTNTVDKHTVLYAKWNEIAYVISLELNGGEMTDRNFNGERDEHGNPYYLYVTGTTQTLHAARRTGYTFEGWYLTETIRPGDRRDTTVDSSIAADTTYYAHWKIRTLTVKFDVNLSTATPNRVATTTIEYGKTINFSQLDDTNGEYIFIGWNTRRDGTGTTLQNGEPFLLETDVTAYAQWIKL